MTQSKLAHDSGVKQPSISELETGETISISGDTLIGVCEALHIRPAWLLNGKGSADSRDEHLPAEAIEVATNWLKLEADLRQSIAATLRAATKPAAPIPPPRRPVKTK